MKKLRETNPQERGHRCLNCGQPITYHHVFTSSTGHEQWVWLHKYTQSQCNQPQESKEDIIQPAVVRRAFEHRAKIDWKKLDQRPRPSVRF